MGTFGGSHGFLLSKGGFTTIDVPGASFGARVRGINIQGDIVGDTFGHGFLLSK